jgi:hypothetical protein
MKKSLRDSVHYVSYFTLSCSGCNYTLEAFRPETRVDLVKTARGCGWKFEKGYVWCEQCLADHPADEGKGE